MEKANKCPKCSSYILGSYCCSCDIDIRLVINPYSTNNPFADFFKDIIEEDENE